MKGAPSLLGSVSPEYNAFLIISGSRNTGSLAVNGFYSDGLRRTTFERRFFREAMLEGNDVIKSFSGATCDQPVTLRLWTGNGPVPHGKVGKLTSVTLIAQRRR